MTSSTVAWPQEAAISDEESVLASLVHQLKLVKESPEESEGLWINRAESIIPQGFGWS